MQWLQDIEDVKSKFEKERQNFFNALSKSSKECENLLKTSADCERYLRYLY
nr:DNA ligase-like protein [Ipomoea batatas]GMD30780.1 DNA ligase-like protein [Ipomoea batatas]